MNEMAIGRGEYLLKVRFNTAQLYIDGEIATPIILIQYDVTDEMMGGMLDLFIAAYSSGFNSGKRDLRYRLREVFDL